MNRKPQPSGQWVYDESRIASALGIVRGAEEQLWLKRIGLSQEAMPCLESGESQASLPSLYVCPLYLYQPANWSA